MPYVITASGTVYASGGTVIPADARPQAFSHLVFIDEDGKRALEKALSPQKGETVVWTEWGYLNLLIVSKGDQVAKVPFWTSPKLGDRPVAYTSSSIRIGTAVKEISR